MGNPTGFLEFTRAPIGHKPVEERIKESFRRGEVSVWLKFGTRAGTPSLDGHVQADLELRCERGGSSRLSTKNRV